MKAKTKKRRVKKVVSKTVSANTGLYLGLATAGVFAGALSIKWLGSRRAPVATGHAYPEGYPLSQGAISAATGGHPEAINEM